MVLAVIATFLLNRTRYGRYVFAVGGNERAARLSGIPVRWIKISVYGLSGLCAGIAGIVEDGAQQLGERVSHRSGRRTARRGRRRARRHRS